LSAQEALTGQECEEWALLFARFLQSCGYTCELTFLGYGQVRIGLVQQEWGAHWPEWASQVCAENPGSIWAQPPYEPVSRTALAEFIAAGRRPAKEEGSIEACPPAVTPALLKQLAYDGATRSPSATPSAGNSLKYWAAVRMGNLYYHVCDGGWGEWHRNEYSKDLPALLDIAKRGVALGIPEFTQLLEMLTVVESVINGVPETEMMTDICPECEGSGYTLAETTNDEGTPDEQEERCEECRGHGTVEYEEKVNKWDYVSDAVDHLNDEFYKTDWLPVFAQFIRRFDEKINPTKIPFVKPVCKLIDTKANVFDLIGRVRKSLHTHGMKNQEREMVKRITTQAVDYHKALAIMMEYVDVS
jgi:hypothetical protein